MSVSKLNDRAALLRDADYFATELVTRLERLGEIEPHGPTHAHWQQAAGMVRRVRGLARHQADEGRRRINRKKVLNGARTSV